jgi:hypothetical protein
MAEVASSAGMATLSASTLRSDTIRMLEPLSTAFFGFGAQRGQAGFDAFLAPGERVADVQFGERNLFSV